jgi:hypothetical protein
MVVRLLYEIVKLQPISIVTWNIMNCFVRQKCSSLQNYRRKVFETGIYDTHEVKLGKFTQKSTS